MTDDHGPVRLSLEIHRDIDAEFRRLDDRAVLERVILRMQEGDVSSLTIDELAAFDRWTDEGEAMKREAMKREATKGPEEAPFAPVRSAEETRELMVRINSERAQSILARLGERIEAAAMNGRSSVFVSEVPCHQGVIEELRRLGYVVRTSDSSYDVSWPPDPVSLPPACDNVVVSSGEDVVCHSILSWVEWGKIHGGRGHRIVSGDDALKRLLGLRDVDEGVGAWLPVDEARCELRTQESWTTTFDGVGDLSVPDLVRSVAGRQKLARLVSGRPDVVLA